MCDQYIDWRKPGYASLSACSLGRRRIREPMGGLPETERWKRCVPRRLPIYAQDSNSRLHSTFICTVFRLIINRRPCEIIDPDGLLHVAPVITAGITSRIIRDDSRPAARATTPNRIPANKWR